MARCRPQPSTLLLAALLACLSVGGAWAADREIRWHAASLESGGEPFDIAAADFNGDGRVDLASTNARDSTVSVFLNLGGGQFAPRQVIPTGEFPRGLVAADLTHDGLADLAVTSTASGRVFVYINRGGGRFDAPRIYAVGTRPFLCASADWNGDGNADLAVANEAQGVSLLLGDGHGGFVAQTIAAGQLPSAIAADDWDGDGRPDLAITSWGSNTLTLYDVHGGVLGAPRQLTSPGYGMFGVAGGDFDRDGVQDIVWNDIRQQGFWIAYGSADGSYRRTKLVPAGPGVRSVRGRDLDGDGWLDLVGADTADGSVSVALSDAHGGYEATQFVPVGIRPRVAEIAELNGDGRPDVAVTNMSSDRIVLLFNEGLEPRAPPLEPGPLLTAASPDVDGFVIPSDVALAPPDALLIVDQAQHRVLRLPLAGGRPQVVVGNGLAGCAGDGGEALQAGLRFPSAVALQPDGSVLVADTDNHRIRRVDAHGIITTIAGGDMDESADAATVDATAVYRPSSLALAPDGTLYFFEQLRARVRCIAPDGRLRDVAGTGVPGQSGDGGAATAAQLGPVAHLAVDSGGALLIADQMGHRIRRIDAHGIITTLAGGSIGGAGDIGAPSSIASDRRGGAYFGTAAALMHVSAQGDVQRAIDLADAHTHGWLLSGPTALVAAPDDRLIATDGGGHVLRFAADGRASVLAEPSHLQTASSR